jgi:hypothetical protein
MPGLDIQCAEAVGSPILRLESPFALAEAGTAGIQSAEHTGTVAAAGPEAAIGSSSQPFNFAKMSRV